MVGAWLWVRPQRLLPRAMWALLSYKGHTQANGQVVEAMVSHGKGDEGPCLTLESSCHCGHTAGTQCVCMCI